MTFVVSTAGHVDHGKSTLVRALTGMEPDRLAEERRRGLSIELGYAWATWPGTGEVAFVDVPGHRRFVRTTLAGLGPVPVVMIVVAADEGWMPQSAEHLAALEALGVCHGVLVISKTDRADPDRASTQARRALAPTGLAGIPEVRVSASDGTGVIELVEVLARVLAELPAADRSAPARLWVDRSFSVTGAGRVVTGTLAAGTIRAGDELTTATGALVRVRGVESLGRPVDEVNGPARVALNVRVRGPGGRAGQIGRGTALVAPGTHVMTSVLDGALRGGPDVRGGTTVLHIGSAAIACRARPIGDRHVRLTLAEPLPLHVGDRALVREPGRPGALVGLTVLDLRPATLSGRGAAARRSGELAGLATSADVAAHLLDAGPQAVEDLTAMGLPADGGIEVAPGWRVSEHRWRDLGGALASMIATELDRDPLAPPPSVASVAARLDLPDDVLAAPLVAAAGLRLEHGVVRPAASQESLPADVEAAIKRLGAWFGVHPYQAPPVDHLAELGLDDRAIGAAARHGQVLRLGPRLVLATGSDAAAYEQLARLAGPFRVADACVALGTTRRTAVPLLELLDRTGRTRRSADGRRTILGR